MLRRTALAATALLAAGALLLTACTGGSSPDPTTTPEADPDASAIIRLVLEPGNLDIRETAGAALDQILIDNIYQGLVSRTPEQDIVPGAGRGLGGLGGRPDVHVHAARGRHLPRRPGAHPAGRRLVAADTQGHS